MSKYKIGDKVYFLDDDEGIVAEIGDKGNKILPADTVWCRWKSNGELAWFDPADPDFDTKPLVLGFENGDVVEEEESGDKGIVIGPVPANSQNGIVIKNSYNDTPENYYFIEWESGEIAYLHKTAFKRIVH